MTHVALARKYRPKQFADLVGQEHVAAGLAGAVAKQRVAHAYLLTGPRGVGKTSAARILAMALNCENKDPLGQRLNTGEPCGTCDSCTRIWSGAASLDVVEIDAASNRGVDDARELRERAMYAASGPGRHKVYIVDEAHMLTREAWNALLKILEEPPAGVVFVFATTEPQKIANTAAPVLSRVQRFDFRRLGPQAVAERLRLVATREQLRVEDDAIHLIARVAAGGMRDALSLLDQALVFGDGGVTAAGVRAALGLIDDELYGELLSILAARRTADVFPLVARLAEAGADLGEFVNGAGELLRALMLRLVAGGGSEGWAGAGEESEAVRRAVDRYAPQFRAGDVLRMLKLLAETEVVIRRSPNARLHVETLLVQWTLLDRTVELGEVLDALKEGGSAVRRVGGSEITDPADARDRWPSPPLPVPPTLPSPPPSSPPLSPPPISAGGPLTLDALRQRWGEVVEAVAREKRVLREAAAKARPVALAGGALTLELDGAAELEGLERGRVVVADAVAAVAGERLQVVLRPAGGGSDGTGASPDVQRLDPRADRQERLKALRAKDQALDAAADLLDLELTE